MKKNIFYSFLLVAISIHVVKAQNNCSDMYWGSNSLYQPGVMTYTPPPETYRPVFINYVGRYGASNLVKDVSTTFVYSILHDGEVNGGLKVDGRKLMKMLLLLQNVEKLKLNTIAETGVEEQKGIAARMKINYRYAFRNDGYCLRVSAIKDDRDIQSAQAFLNMFKYSLTTNCTQPDYDDADNLQFFAVAPAYIEFDKKEDWKSDVDNVRDTRKPDNFNIKFLTRFFEQRYFDKLDEEVQNKFVSDMYNLSLIQNAIQPEIAKAGYTKEQLDIRAFFTCDELAIFNELNSAKDFLRMGPGTDKAGIQVKDAVPLLVNFLNTTDAYSTSTNVAADLRFGYPETVSSFATLMNIKGVSKESADILKFSKVWKADEIIPYSANIQWILYKSEDSDFRRDYLVKFLLNEQEVAIDGLKAKDFPYYKWDDVKAYYTKRLTEELDVEKLSDNMHAYLLNLR